MWYNEISVDLLPEPYSTIKNIIGSKKTLLLLQLQGRAFYFNKKNNPAGSPISEVIDLIGEDAADKLKNYFGFEYVYFRKIDETLRIIRNEKIVNEFDGGNFGYLCKKYNLTERFIRNILSDARASEFSGSAEQLKFY